MIIIWIEVRYLKSDGVFLTSVFVTLYLENEASI